MPTSFGKELRKLRIDKDENINNMAKKLEMSISYLSLIETGDRKIPEDMVEKIIKKYRLNKERSEKLRQAAIETSEEIKINLLNSSFKQKELVYILSRKLKDLSDEECADILEKVG